MTAVANDTLTLTPGVVVARQQIMFPYPPRRTSADYARSGTSVIAGSTTYEEDDNAYDLSFEKTGIVLTWKSSTSVAAAVSWSLSCPLAPAPGGALAAVNFEPVSRLQMGLAANQTADAFDMAWIGDSRTAAGNLGSPERTASNGPQFWTEALTYGRVRCPLAYNFGVSGETSAEILARVPAALAACPAPIWHVLASINDGTADSAGNVLAIVAALQAAGKVVIVTPELPRISGWTTARIAQHDAVFNRLRVQNLPRVYIADPWADFVDYTLTTGAVLADRFYDSPPIHPSNLGAYYMGRAIAAILNAILPEPSILPRSNAGAWDATVNQRGWLTPNPMLYGTGGALNGSATGAAADSMTITRTGSDITVAASKVSSGGKLWQQIEIGGTPSTNTQRATASILIPLASVSVGDVIEGVCEFEVDAAADGVHGPSLEINPVTGTTAAVSTNYDTWARGVGYAPNVAHAGIMRTPPLVVASGLTSLPLQVIARAEQGVACAMTFRIRAMAARKIV